MKTTENIITENSTLKTLQNKDLTKQEIDYKVMIQLH